MFDSLIGEPVKEEKKDICVAWDANALSYLANGYSVIPLAPHQKGPKLPNWNKFCNELMDVNTAKAFYGKNNNIGLALGEASGLCAVDIDTNDPEWIKRIENYYH